MWMTLISGRLINTMILPAKVEGQYWLNHAADTAESLIGIEGVDGQWFLVSNRNACLQGYDRQPIERAVVAPHNAYAVHVRETGESAIIYAEPATLDRICYQKYVATAEEGFNIGRAPGSHILYDCPLVSSSHATLHFSNGTWRVIDKGSGNGTFVNGRRVAEAALKPGDVIYIMGCKIVIGKQFFAINNPDGCVSVASPALSPYAIQVPGLRGQKLEEDAPRMAQAYFYRSPRFKRDVETAEFRVDSPPSNAIGDEMPLMMVLGPSMTMGMASMATAAFSISRAMDTGDFASAAPSIAMSSSMLLGTVMWPVLSKRYDKKRRRKAEALRQKKYRQYLHRLSSDFESECAKQEEILRENYISADACCSRILEIKRNLWERGRTQNDFLQIMAGMGEGVLDAQISYSERKFELIEDNLQEELFTLCEAPKILKDIPITVSFFNDYISGIIGDAVYTDEFIKGLIVKFAALYGYDEVKFVFILGKHKRETFHFVRWLPHAWNDDRSFRFIAMDGGETKELSAYLEKEFEARETANESDMEDISPYYLIFAMDKELSLRTDVLKQIYAKKRNLNFSVVFAEQNLNDLPKECSLVMDIRADGGRLFDKSDISGKYKDFVPDLLSAASPGALSVQLANIPLDTLANSYNLPAAYTFLEMFGVGKVEHLNLPARWKENDPTRSLETAVGVSTLGEPFMLDLHEKFHGPHGLVAGMTGSGKSEFIIAYILSLAVNYHPEEVAFVLIDYKGGGMAKSFEHLPHTAGVITNLDGAAIKRSLTSIESELKRRQAIFANASKDFGVSNIDIYKYQKLYREGSAIEPLPHLFIISDEFAELKTQQPEFMEKLVSAARIGRSLGVHLILATQKPSGVVDDQIWSNSKFRVCLKVQDRSDSMDMLKRPDAAFLKETGRFYLQVGYNELFEMGQSAWAGAPYVPAERATPKNDKVVSIVDNNGRAIRQMKLNTGKQLGGDPQKQLDAITAYISAVAAEAQIKVRSLWLEPIEPVILIGVLWKQYQDGVQGGNVLNPIIGEYDDPTNQCRGALSLPLSHSGNAIVYGTAGAGKTTFINAMAHALIQNHTPDEVNIYLLDFASETLRAFQDAPQVGDVLFSSDEEKIKNLFKMLLDELGRRRKRFADYGGDYLSFVKKSGEKLPNLVIAVNNFSAFTEIYEDLEDAVLYLSREGTKYGIYFVLSSLGTNGVRFRMLQNFKQNFVMQLADESDYAALLGRTEGLIPAGYKGRGLVRLDNLYEFQIASLTESDNPYEYIRAECQRLRTKWAGLGASSVPTLPKTVDATFLSAFVIPETPLKLPIGVDKISLQVAVCPFGASYIYPITYSESEPDFFIRTLCELLSGYCSGITLKLLDYSNVLHLSDRDFAFCGKTGCEQAVSDLFEIIVTRHNACKDAEEQGREIEDFERVAVIIHGFESLRGNLEGEHAEKLDLLLERGKAALNVSFLIVEREKNLSGLAYEKWFKDHISLADLIWVGPGISDQYLFTVGKTTSSMREEIPEGFGYLITKGKAAKVKLAGASVGENENE